VFAPKMTSMKELRVLAISLSCVLGKAVAFSETARYELLNRHSLYQWVPRNVNLLPPNYCDYPVADGGSQKEIPSDLHQRPVVEESLRVLS